MHANAATQAMYLLLSRYSVIAAVKFWNECHVPFGCDAARAVVLINRYWRDVLGAQDHCTREARSYLIDDCPFHEWLSLFERGVIPEIVQCPLVYPA